MGNLQRRLERLELLATRSGPDVRHIVIVPIHEDDDESVIRAKREEKVEEFWRQHSELDPATTRIEFIHIVGIVARAGRRVTPSYAHTGCEISAERESVC
jgi:hypothetical protein